MKSIFCFLFLCSVFTSYAQEKPEGLFINSKAYDFKAKDQNGNEVNLRDLRKKGNVVIMFYRGYWCPFCERYLKKVQDSLSFITDKGAQVIAITSEGKEGIDTTIQKTGASFPIIFDQDMKISENYHVAYKVDDRTVARLKNTDIDLLKINEQKQAYLPVTAVYIINKEGSVTFRYFDEDYKKRVSIKEIIKNL